MGIGQSDGSAGHAPAVVRADAGSGSGSRNNLLAIAAVIGAGFFLICGDALLRGAAGELPLGEMIVGRSVVACALLALAARSQGALYWHPGLNSIAVGLRVLGEVGAALFFVAAILRMPLANAASILQFIPLITTVAAAWLFAERVGWQRWCAGAVGLVGVLLVLQPGTSGFTWWSLLAIGSDAVHVVARPRDHAHRPSRADAADRHRLGSRRRRRRTCDAAAGAMADAVGASSRARRGGGSFVAAGFYCMVQAMRLGEVSAVAPFRYGTILWALLIGIVIWGEVPNVVAVLGIVIVVGAGLATFARERRLNQARLARARG